MNYVAPTASGYQLPAADIHLSINKYKKRIQFFWIFMESWILREWSPSWSPFGFTLTLQETQSIHDSMNIQKIEFLCLYTEPHF